jgi:hypothetical protein
MDNPFENVVVDKKPKQRRRYKPSQLYDFFPEESSNTVQLKKSIGQKISDKFPDLTEFQVFKVAQMLVIKYFYKLNYPNEEKIDEVINTIEDFEMFKTI